MLTGFFTKLSRTGLSTSILVVPTTDAPRMIPPTSELFSLRKNSESVRKTDWVILVLFSEPLRLSNSELGSDNDPMASSVSEKDRLLMSSCELVSLKLLLTSALKVRPRKLSSSTSSTATANDRRVKTTFVSFSGIGMLSVTSSVEFLRLHR